MSEDLQLDFYQTQLDDLIADHKSVAEQLRTEQNAASKNKLNRQLEQINKDIKEFKDKINQYKTDQKTIIIQNTRNELVRILTSHASQIEEMQNAYQKTIVHWPAAVNSSANTVDSIIIELERIVKGGSPHTAQEEFIAHLVANSSEASLVNALNHWSEQHRDGRDWLALHHQIQLADEQRLATAQPAILIAITRSDQASTQSSSGETFYQMNAWLIKDIATYQEHKTGYHALIAPGSPESAPCLLEALLQNVPQLVQHFIEQKNHYCPNCENYPETHVFLPPELIYLGVDVWQLHPEPRRRPAYLGHDHVVVLRCMNRYDGNYKNAPSWRRLWNNRLPQLGHVSANEVFVPSHDQDIDALIELLDDAVDDDRIIGLHLTQAPIDTEAMCYELLDSGLPLAIWPRVNLLNNDLRDLLAADCLKKLPQTVQRKRKETRKAGNQPDSHIGHHLSLLWDNPHLVPPKSA